jgi:hypothetical protein
VLVAAHSVRMAMPPEYLRLALRRN